MHILTDHFHTLTFSTVFGFGLALGVAGFIGVMMIIRDVWESLFPSKKTDNEKERGDKRDTFYDE